MSFLIVGLGNIGSEYDGTRHNIGFEVLDEIAKRYKANFEPDRYANITEISIRGKKVTLIKPTTFMNLSGKAVRHWQSVGKVPNNRIMVVTDDINLDIGKLRIRPSGSDGGHNGLKNINLLLGHNQYPRLKFGVGSDFPRGRQVEYVLGKWGESQRIDVDRLIEKAADAVEVFVARSLQEAMNAFNG